MSHESLVWIAATETAERIERTLSEALRVLDRAGVGASLVEGSALSAELSASDELIRRFASRASLSVAPSLIDRAERALVEAGWQRAEAQGDLHLLRAAVRHGRHLVFALLDDDADPPGRTRLHPSHPEAVRQRNERLSRWRTTVRVTLSRLRTYEDDFGRMVTETFELGLVEAGAGGTHDPRAG